MCIVLQVILLLSSIYITLCSTMCPCNTCIIIPCRPVILSSKQSHVTSLLKSDPVTSSFSHPSPSTTPEVNGDRVLQVMKWGLVPNWHRGEASKFPTLLNNCRCEGLMEKPSFRNAVQKKQRCVVLADG